MPHQTLQESDSVPASAATIPIIDFSTFLQPPSAAAKRETAQALLHAFQTSGFAYLAQHGIPAALVQQTFAASAAFFARPQGEKDALAWTTPEANRGYSCPGREKTTDLQDAAAIEAIRALEGADRKESMEIGREGVAGLPNRWPVGDAAAEGFRAQMMAFHARLAELHAEILRAVAVGLGIAEDYFDGFCDRADNTLRLLHYPAVERKVWREKKNTVRAGAHTDYGSVTCLFQDMAGGLQVLSPQGVFVDATPIADTIVINAGDLLARWSNDTIKSTKHRVVEPPPPPGSATVTMGEGGEATTTEFHPARYSIAYFCNPNFDRFIDAIPGTVDEARPKKYAGVNSGEYIVQRLSATY